ncbi:MAG: NTE family protein [Halioglobus sp.]|jgi:NTE family protein
MYGIVLLLFAAVLHSNSADASACIANDTDRLKIGLVLGGGGARGAAHIGVIQKLEELRVPVDFIAGTSMGSIVGGLHAAGMTGAELEELIIGIDWTELFQSDTRRADRPFRRKRDDDLSLFGPKLGVGEKSQLLPQGAISGQKISFFFSSVVNQRVQTQDFDELPIPYRAVAADVISGDQVILDRGDMGLAMRSSMSIPGVFAPVVYRDYMLIDGGIVNNIPIDVARDMGADIIIAVDVGTPLSTREELTDLISITGQLTGFLVVGNSQRQLATLGAKDIHLQPKLGNTITSGSFDVVDQAIPLGYKAADAASEQLAALSLTPQAYARYRQQISDCQPGLPTVQFVQLNNTSRLSDEVLEQHIHTAIGQTLDLQTLETDIEQIYALGFLESARYEVVEREGQTGVVFHVEQDKRGTQFIEWGMDVFGNEDSTNLNLRMGFLKTDLDTLGSEFRGILQLGEDLGFLTELYKPLENSQHFVFIPKIFGERREIIQFDADGNKLNEFRVEELGASVLLAYEIERHAAISSGIHYSRGDVALEIGDPSLEDFSYENAAYQVSLQYDRVDDSYFPSSGTLFSLSYLNYNEELGSDHEFEQVLSTGYTAATLKRHTVIGGFTYNTTLDDNAPIQNFFRAGGFGRLSGIRENEISGQHFGLVYGSYRYKFSDSDLLPAYLGATLEYGNAVDERSDIFGEGITAGSVYMGFRTPVGPVYIGYGLAEGYSGNYFLRIGNVFQRSALGQ